jgi:hypothetical protein
MPHTSLLEGTQRRLVTERQGRMSIIRNDEMLNQVQHDNRDEFSVTLNLFQGLMNTELPSLITDYGYGQALTFDD